MLLEGPTYGAGIFTISVSAVDDFGCLVRDTILVEVAIPVGTNTATADTFSGAPNPVKDYFYVNLSEGKWQLVLRDVWGQTVWRGDAEGPSGQVEMSQLAAGVYLLEGQHLRGERRRGWIVKQ